MLLTHFVKILWKLQKSQETKSETEQNKTQREEYILEMYTQHNVVSIGSNKTIKNL